jgi:hypothetical protein
VASKQAIAIFGILSFLGTSGALLACVAVILSAKLIGEHRLHRAMAWSSDWVFGGRGLARKLIIAVLILVAGYFGILLVASFASREWTLEPGQEKYFCEIDCHLAYSVLSAARVKTVGSSPYQATASGIFYVVNLQTRFDETTISSHRGDWPLTPNPRVVTIVDGRGRHYGISTKGQEALERSLVHPVPLTQPLRPGESYSTQLVFDLPSDALNLRLLIESSTPPAWIARVLVGDEGSFLHKKVFLGLRT